MKQDINSESYSLPLGTNPIAMGRLGCIYNSLNKTTGQMHAVECMNVNDTVAELSESSSRVHTIQQLLEAELQRCSIISNTDRGKHVFCYNSVESSQARICLHATSSVIGSLASLQKDFNRLHPLAIKQYVYYIVCGLYALHQAGFTCGGVRNFFVVLHPLERSLLSLSRFCKYVHGVRH
ncbi:putative protein kinase-like domain superfamily [Plasmopara halstedii]